MRVPISWLRDFVALPNDTHAIAQRLAMLGFPVESIETRPKITGVVTARIVTVEKHPNADRLLVARVDAGGDEPLTIATAATNVAAGQTIAVATIGAKLPQLEIAARTMRGVASQGMMISAGELALPEEWFEDGIMQLDSGIEPGVDAVALFGLDTDVLDVEITANRPDSMSVLGLARELAASYGVPLAVPPLDNPGRAREPGTMSPRVTIESPDCSRFVAQRFEDLAVGPAPAWMRVRLALAGQRPINNLVDVSNYVMLETGQPLHFYDAANVRELHFIVRDARPGERLVTLDGTERELTPQALVIADGERALGLAGLMGGASSEVTPVTSSIVLEAANFNGPRIRRMSAALGLRTEASSRHEKSLAPALADMGAARATQLLQELGATADAPHVFGGEIPPAPQIALPVAEVERLLGLALPAVRIAEHLRALGCTVEFGSGESLLVTPPAWRRDLTIAADLVEEVARVEGYERIEAVVPSIPAHAISSAAFDRENRIAQTLAALGYYETITHSLRPCAGAQAPEVRNPLSEEHRVLRDSLVPGLLEYFAGPGKRSRVFEIGQIFARDGAAVVEQSSAAFGFCAARDGEPPWRDAAFLRIKGDCEVLLRTVTGRQATISPASGAGFHPGKTAAVAIEGTNVGLVGCVDPRLTKALDLGANAYLCVIAPQALPPYRIPRYRAPSKFPSTYRDLALVLETAVSARDVEETIAAALGPLCAGVRVFDEYRGPQVPENRKSLAVRITLQRYDATITDEEADAAIEEVLKKLRERLGATIRT